MPFKVLRGMASLEAIRDRLDVEDADRVELEAIGAKVNALSADLQDPGVPDRLVAEAVQLAGPDGMPVRLAPGNTWVELVPNGTGGIARG